MDFQSSGDGSSPWLLDVDVSLWIHNGEKHAEQGEQVPTLPSSPQLSALEVFGRLFTEHCLEQNRPAIFRNVSLLNEGVHTTGNAGGGGGLFFPLDKMRAALSPTSLLADYGPDLAVQVCSQTAPRKDMPHTPTVCGGTAGARRSEQEEEAKGKGVEREDAQYFDTTLQAFCDHLLVDGPSSHTSTSDSIGKGGAADSAHNRYKEGLWYLKDWHLQLLCEWKTSTTTSTANTSSFHPSSSGLLPAPLYRLPPPLDQDWLNEYALRAVAAAPQTTAPSMDMDQQLHDQHVPVCRSSEITSDVSLTDLFGKLSREWAAAAHGVDADKAQACCSDTSSSQPTTPTNRHRGAARPALAPSSVPPPTGDYRFAYLGEVGTFTRRHHDVFGSYSWSFNVTGTKRWRFYSDKARADHCCPTESSSLSASSSWIEIVQSPGDLVFVPSLVDHDVHNIRAGGREGVGGQYNGYNPSSLSCRSDTGLTKWYAVNDDVNGSDGKRNGDATDDPSDPQQPCNEPWIVSVNHNWFNRFNIEVVVDLLLSEALAAHNCVPSDTRQLFRPISPSSTSPAVDSCHEKENDTERRVKDRGEEDQGRKGDAVSTGVGGDGGSGHDTHPPPRSLLSSADEDDGWLAHVERMLAGSGSWNLKSMRVLLQYIIATRSEALLHHQCHGTDPREEADPKRHCEETRAELRTALDAHRRIEDVMKQIATS